MQDPLQPNFAFLLLLAVGLLFPFVAAAYLFFF